MFTSSQSVRRTRFRYGVQGIVDAGLAVVLLGLLTILFGCDTNSTGQPESPPSSSPSYGGDVDTNAFSSFGTCGVESERLEEREQQPLHPPPAPAPDHRVPSDVTRITGQEYDVDPGDVVCLEPGTRPSLVLDGVEGSAAKPVVLTNCSGRTATIRDDRFGIVLRESRHIRIAGGQSSTRRFGLVVNGGEEAKVGLSVDRQSSNVEASFVEIKNTTFAGVIAKTENANAGAGTNFVLRDLHLHDLYVHDTGGEGMYLGSTSVGPDQHLVENLRVHDNVVVRTGWDGIQVGNTTDDANVHHNVIYRAGIGDHKFHSNGLQISANSAGRFHHNLIVRSDKWGIAIFGKGDVHITENLVSDSKGIFVDNRPGTVPSDSITIRRNKAHRLRTEFVRVLNEKNPVTVQDNQLEGVREPVRVIEAARGNVSACGNERASVEAVAFSDPRRDNFCLPAQSPHARMGLSNCR